MRWKIAIGLLPLCLAACGGEPEPVVQTDLEQVDPTGQQVTFWYQHALEREDLLVELIAEFNRGNTWGIQVQGEYTGGYSDIFNKMLVGMQAGSLPDLVVAYNNQATVYFINDGVVDLKPYMDSPKWGLSAEALADYYSAFVEQDNYQGVQVAFPPNRSMELLYYNEDWLRELGYDRPPENWEVFAEMCLRARDQVFSGAEDKRRHVGFLLHLDASQLASMVFSRGGDFMREGVYTLSTPQVRDALRLMRELVQEGAVEVLSDPGQDINEFSLGQLLFFTDSSTGLPYVKSGVESGVGFAWDVSPLPHTTGEPAVNVYGASVAVCRTSPERELAAWLFVKWFTEPEQQVRWVEASGYFPVRKSTADMLQDYFTGHPRYAKAYDWLDYGRTEPAVTGYEYVRRIIATAMFDVLDGEDIDAVLNRLERDANQELASF